MKNYIKIFIIPFISIVLLIITIFYLNYNYKHIIADFKYPIKDIDISFFNEMDIDNLNQIILISNEKKVRYYDINSKNYSYYTDRIWFTIKQSNNINELSELKKLMIKNNITSIYNDWYIYFDYGDNDNFKLWYDKFNKIIVWNIMNNWRVEKVINNGWFIIRKCNEYICGESI